MIIFDLINLQKIRRAILYLAVIAVSLVLQNTMLNHVAPLGVRCMFIPAVTAVIGMLEGGVWGCMLGVAAGALCDISFSGSTVLFTLTLPVVGCFSGVVGEYLVNRRFLACCLTALAVLAVAAFVQALAAFFSVDARFGAVMRTAALQTAWSVPFIFPAWLSCRAIYGMGR